MAARLDIKFKSLALEPQQNALEAAVGPAPSPLDDSAPYTPLNLHDIEKVWASVVFEGDAKLSLYKLAKDNIVPKFSCQIDSVRFDFSDVFTLENRNYVFALVHNEAKVTAKIFYLSNSQGYWRSLVGRYRCSSHIYKGKNENSIHLPLQLHLTIVNATSKQEKPHHLKHTTSILRIILPTSQDDASFDDIFPEITKPRHLMTPIEGQPVEIKHLGSTIDKWTKPHLLNFKKPTHSPNFERYTMFTYTNSPYGNLIGYLLPSIDEELEFLFYLVDIPELKRDAPFLFLAHVDCKGSKLTSYCVNNTYSHVFDLTNPLFEYTEQIPVKYQMSVFSRSATARRGTVYRSPYSCAWNYIREFPIILSFYEKVLQIPPPDPV